MSGEDKVSGGELCQEENCVRRIVSGGELCPEDNCVRRRNAFAGDQVSGEEMWLEIKLQKEKCARRSNVSGA